MVYAVLFQMGALNLVAIGVLAWSHFQRHGWLYFPGMLHLMASPVMSLLLCLLGLWAVLLASVLLKDVFIGGKLRAVELTHLREYGWLTVSEFLLSMTTFRDDFSPRFVLKFALLMVLKCGHWLARDRTDLAEEMPDNLPPHYRLRQSAFLGSLFVIDVVGIISSLDDLLRRGPSSTLLFITEFLVMFFGLVSAGCRHVLNEHDRLRARDGLPVPWEHRSSIIFQVDLVSDTLRLIASLVFFGITIRYYGFPLHMFRDIVITGYSLSKRLTDAVKFQRAVRELDRRYPDISPEDLAQLSDRTCIICREEMTALMGVHKNKRLVCGHVFHLKCLQTWLERQQTCPTCRRDIFSPASNTPSPNSQGLDNQGPNNQGAIVHQPRVPPDGYYPGNHRQPSHEQRGNVGLRNLNDPDDLDRLQCDLEALVHAANNDDENGDPEAALALENTRQAIQRLKRSLSASSNSSSPRSTTPRPPIPSTPIIPIIEPRNGNEKEETEEQASNEEEDWTTEDEDRKTAE